MFVLGNEKKGWKVITMTVVYVRIQLQFLFIYEKLGVGFPERFISLNLVFLLNSWIFDCSFCLLGNSAIKLICKENTYLTVDETSAWSSIFFTCFAHHNRHLRIFFPIFGWCIVLSKASLSIAINMSLTPTTFLPITQISLAYHGIWLRSQRCYLYRVHLYCKSSFVRSKKLACCGCCL